MTCKKCGLPEEMCVCGLCEPKKEDKEEILKNEEWEIPLVKHKYKSIILREGERCRGFIYAPDGDLVFESEHGIAGIVDNAVETAKSQIWIYEMAAFLEVFMEKLGYKLEKDETKPFD